MARASGLKRILHELWGGWWVRVCVCLLICLGWLADLPCVGCEMHEYVQK